VVVRASDGLTTTCKVALAVLAGVEESLTVTVKLYVVGLVLAVVRFPERAALGAVGVPEMTPVEVSKDKPAGKVPDVTAHV
jgi:hypothetical protein